MEKSSRQGPLWTPELFFPHLPTRQTPTAVAAANELSRQNLNSSPFYRLPTELVEEVARYLNSVDVYCLGRVCKKTLYLLTEGRYRYWFNALHWKGMDEWRVRSQRDRLNKELEAGGGIVEDDWESE
jgi:hypothetical protein